MTASEPKALLTLAAGFGVWTACFIVIYAVQGIGCAYGWQAPTFGPVSLLRILLVVLAGAGTLATLAVARRLSRTRGAEQPNGTAAFIFAVASYTAYVAVPSTLFTFSGVLMTSMCN